MTVATTLFDFAFPAFFLALALIWLGFRVFEDRRSKRLKACARSLNLQFAKDGTFDILDDFKSFKIASNRVTPAIANCIYPAAGEVKIAILEFAHMKDGIEEDTRILYKVVFVRSQKLKAPSFHVRPRTIPERLLSFLIGWPAIDFSMRPEFSENWAVHADRRDDESRVRERMTSGVMDLFVRHPKAMLEFQNGKFILYFQGTLEPPDIQPLLSAGMDLHSLLAGKMISEFRKKHPS